MAGYAILFLIFKGVFLKLRVVLIRAKDGLRIEKEDEFSSPEKVNNTFKLFYPNLYKAYAIYKDDKLLYCKGIVTR